MNKDIILTTREREILYLIKNFSLKDIASNLGISYRTLQWHLGRLYAKFRVQNKFQLIVKHFDEIPDFEKIIS